MLKNYTIEELAKAWLFYKLEPKNSQADNLASEIYKHACLFRSYNDWHKFWRLITRGITPVC